MSLEKTQPKIVFFLVSLSPDPIATLAIMLLFQVLVSIPINRSCTEAAKSMYKDHHCEVV